MVVVYYDTEKEKHVTINNVYSVLDDKNDGFVTVCFEDDVREYSKDIPKEWLTSINVSLEKQNDITESLEAERDSHVEKQNTTMKIEVYQINHLRDLHRVKFQELESLERWQGFSSIESHIYDKVFEGEVPCSNLEGVYSLFNTSSPEGHAGHSLSVSDIVKVCYNQPGLEQGFYYCDSVGFKKVGFEPTKAFSKLSRQSSSLSEVIDKAEAIKIEQEPIDSCVNKDKNKEVCL